MTANKGNLGIELSKIQSGQPRIRIFGNIGGRPVFDIMVYVNPHEWSILDRGIYQVPKAGVEFLTQSSNSFEATFELPEAETSVPDSTGIIERLHKSLDGLEFSVMPGKQKDSIEIGRGIKIKLIPIHSRRDTVNSMPMIVIYYLVELLETNLFQEEIKSAQGCKIKFTRTSDDNIQTITLGNTDSGRVIMFNVGDDFKIEIAS